MSAWRSTGPAEERLQAEQIRLLYHSGPAGTVAALVAAFVLAIMVWNLGVGSRLALVIWLVVIVFDVSLHLLLARAYHRRGAGRAAWRRWAYGFVGFSFLDGLIWGVGAIYLSAPAAIVQQMLIGLVVCAVVTGSLSAFGVYLPAFYALFVTATLPFLVACLMIGGFLHDGMAVLIAVYMCGMLAVARLHNGNMTEMVRLRFENADLAAALRVQKEAAEAASLAKTRFLAAASHDLRQPVHALGLFVGALRGYRLEAEPRLLVDRIEESVSAMDGLFSALLDISRLDAGVVAPEWQVFPIQPLLERVLRDYAAEAASKGVSLRMRNAAWFVRSDPVLLERILRNLVANAVRYTDHGGVLVGCRKRAALRIEVWDTGRGIAQADLPRVFEEFYQIDNPERDRARGLGLGLAIVRRLAGLLGHALHIRSRPGRGSVFGLDVPLAQRAPVVQGVPAQGASRRGLILVVDDEVAIQDGMRSLLQGWGHDVLCAGSGAEMAVLLGACARRPDLIICDYRLRGGETGAEVIASLQRAYGQAIPGLLITGDTAPDRLEEATGSGLLLLHKPVANSRLRAAVNHFLRVR
jgi:signal transduction histidine kinase/CheY-like chemotaxis protein